MQLDSAHLRYVAAAAPPAPSRAGAAPATSAVGGTGALVDTLELGVPHTPPPDALEQVTAAARCVEEMTRNNRELHFRPDEHSNRIIIEVRDMTGNVLKTIPPSKALDILTASPGRESQWLA